MAIVVALFMGLTVSAEEIIRDKKILKRERFLSLSKTSYLLSKLTILFTLSAIQTLTFVLIGNYILDIHNMFWGYWLILFSTACFANILGLNVSATFNSAVTVYIVIPILLIPQMVLSGALFSFDKLNSAISSKEHPPVIADIMASRWAYEGVAVHQFKSNGYTKHFYQYDKKLSEENYYRAYLVPEFKNIVRETRNALKGEKTIDDVSEKTKVIKNTLAQWKENPVHKKVEIDLKLDFKNTKTFEKLLSIADEIMKIHNHRYNIVMELKDKKTKLLIQQLNKKDQKLSQLKSDHYNEALEELVRNTNSKERIIMYEGQFIQKIDPIYNTPEPSSMLDYKAQFYAPEKHFLGVTMSTFWFNIIVIWFMSLILYFTLYAELFRKIIDYLGSITFKKE
jgi:hypothetical protein